MWLKQEYLKWSQKATEDWKAEAEKWLHRRAKEIIEKESKKFDTLKIIKDYMIDKQAQDERWQALTEDGRQARIASYKELLKMQKEEVDSYLITIEDLEKLYGKHNLNPKQIKTWEDVEKEGLDEFEYELDKPNSSKKDSKIAMKCQATLKISKLIELGYGGMVSEEEWKDEYKSKWVINCDMSKETRFEILEMFVDKFFIAFHEESQAEEFMSYESNRQLVQQYFLM